ncbi:MAG: SPOR domain-containing protein [Chitinophagaceae bacterium]|nr:SPOR domain-containing protein [Chitinophagaceae bacterium]
MFAVLALCFSSSLLAQDTVSKKPVDSISTITVHKDARLDQLIKKQSYVNDITSREGRRTDKGFRLMIISTNSRDEAMAAKTRVYTYFPELKAYLWYQSPYFRVKAGNFKDRKDAEEFQKRLNNYFPKGVFIMKDIIEVKPGKAGESEN